MDSGIQSRINRVRERLKNPVQWILNDELMIVLALLLIPVVALPLFFTLSRFMTGFLSILNYVIIAAFIAEYFLKLFIADSKKEFVSDTWHILDLFIIVLALMEFLPLITLGYGEASPILRLLRVLRIFTAAGRSTDMVPRAAETPLFFPTDERPTQVSTLDAAGRTSFSNFDPPSYIPWDPGAQWIHIQNTKSRDLDVLSRALSIPAQILQSKLNKDAITRIDYFKEYTTIFLRDSRISTECSTTGEVHITMDGLLIICRGHQIITLCTGETNLFNSVSGLGSDSDKTPFAGIVLYQILRKKIADAEEILEMIEKRVALLEDIPMEATTTKFLEDTLSLRKEIQKITKTLWHARQVFDTMRSQKVALDSLGDEDLNLFDMICDDADYLYETAQNLGENLSALRELHINSISYNMTRVMKLLAVITTLALIPTTIGGLLGENLYDSPWNVNIFEILFIVFLLMVLALYAFYRKGWLR
jgi:Mg2+ and Co2+ transporter CorA